MTPEVNAEELERLRECAAIVEDMAQYLRGGKGPIDIDGWEEIILAAAKAPELESPPTFKQVWLGDDGHSWFFEWESDWVLTIKRDDGEKQLHLTHEEGPLPPPNGASNEEAAALFVDLGKRFNVDLTGIIDHDGQDYFMSDATPRNLRRILDLAGERDA